MASIPLEYQLLGLAMLPLTLWANYAGYLLIAADRLRAQNRAQLAGSTCAALATVLLVLVLGRGVRGALAATLAGQLVASAAVAVVLVRAAGRVRLSRAVASRYVVDGSRLHLTAIGAFVFSSLDILMVDHFRGKAEAGHFQLAFQLFTPLLIVPQAVADVVSGKLSSLGVRGVWPHQRRLMLLTAAGMVAVAGALAVAAPLIVRLLAGREFAASVPIFRIYLLGIPAAVINGMMAVQWIGRGLFLQTSLITLAAGTLNFGLNLMFIPRWGAVGAAVATAVGVYAIPFTANAIMWARCERAARSERAGADAAVPAPV
jgi:O-antigen/teichoic acid export membrane protein